MAYENPQVFNNPPATEGSHPQLIPFYIMQRKALTDLKKEQFFGQLADTTSMPKHFGKTIKRYHYIPLLDDRNINDQGIDATGLSVADEVTITVTAMRTAGWDVHEGTAVNNGGNLYGSSKDVGTIVGKLPAISETGGRVNRVGFTRLTLEGTIDNFGFFDEYTEDSVQFDNDADLMQHISRETLRAANYIVEAQIQIDLLNGANVVYYGGDATSLSELTGETSSTASVLDYETLVRVETILNNNLCPKDTTIISGSRMVDTRTIGAARYAYVGSELKMQLLKMKNFHNEAAFIPVQQYTEAGKAASGEIGSIGNYRFIENPNMFHWDGAGAAVANNDGYLESNGKYNVYPVLVVGSGSFTTIGFQTDGENTKFKILHKAPGKEMANRNDPYGKIGFYSIQWWYGTMLLRPEWIAVIKVVAER